MNLHNNKKAFRQAIQYTADQLRISPVFIEKDYWVTFALYTISNNEVGKDTIFKGGTALSKCYKLIERFSEDIDLVVVRREGEADNKLKSKLKTIGTIVSEYLPEVPVEGLTVKMGMNRKTAHHYEKVFSGNFGQARDVIVLEATWLGYYEPYSIQSVNSLIGETILANGQSNLAVQYGLLPFEFQVLDPQRTICEKIMSLVRFSHISDYPLEALKHKIRHIYDLYQMLNHSELHSFFESSDFTEMLIKVATDDLKSFRNNNEWLNIHPCEALIFSQTEHIWPELKAVYEGNFKHLVYGDLPPADRIFETLTRVRDRLSKIEWPRIK
ncbi:MAG: nucleotidyl transferase AbiEii/AbiGii toxin family protein [Bacteroidales bacterium]